MLTYLFTESFFGEICKWCDEHELPLCGHLLAEDQLNFQRIYIGSAMRSYEKMQIPGIDVLTEHWNIFNTAKQCTSAAHQTGKKFRLSETYGCTGWDFPLFGHKALGDWQYALGINRRCLHLSWYSMKGEAKRDYPASFLHHSPWYQQYGIIEKHFARLSAAFSNDNEIRDLLVINPVESSWSVSVASFPGNSNTTLLLDKLDQDNIDLTNLLLAEKLDFDFGDEEMMSRLGSVSGRKIRIGQASYNQILIPELLTIRSTTLELLSKFEGKVFYLGRIPRFVDAVPSTKAVEIYAKFIPCTMKNVTEKIASDYRRVSICNKANEQAKAVLYRLSDCDDGYSLFLCNFSMEFTSEHMNAPMLRNRKIVYPALDVVLDLPFRGNIAELDTASAKTTPVKYVYENGKYKFKTSLEQLQSRLFFIGRDFAAADIEVKTEKLPAISLPDAEYDYKLHEENILVLDHAAWETPEKSQKTPQFILHADTELRGLAGAAPRSGAMLQPWVSDLSAQNKPQKSIPLKLFYTFECEEIPKDDCFLTLEQPEKFTIYINDSELVQVPCGHYLDRALVNLQLKRTLFKKGINKLTLVCSEYNPTVDLEAIFIRGFFGVKNGSICSLQPKLTPSDWCLQGLENYAGNVTYFAEIDNQSPCQIEFPDFRGTLIGIKINDYSEKILLMPPFAAELPQGKCSLAITLYGHRRNAFGPFFTEKWPMLSSSGTFKKYDTPTRQLVPCGLKIKNADLNID